MPTTYAIPNGSTAFAATTYTGTGATQSVSNAVNGTSFQPDFVWFKSRATTYYHALFDSVRGVTKGLASNDTAFEFTSTAGADLAAFTSTGFTVGAPEQWNSPNNSSSNPVAWQWKAGGAAVTNTAGSITSQVSANTAAGFSVVTYTGTGAAATVGHGLGVAPNMIIFKGRNYAIDWAVYHASIGAGSKVYLNLTNASAADTTYMNNTAPTSSVFSIAASSWTNNSSAATYVAYCFAAVPGYSAFGTWQNNNSTDGTFIYTGFRPRFILLKNYDNVERWFTWDSTRQTYNMPPPSNNWLVPNDSAAEGANGAQTAEIDGLSNGFKIRTTNPASGEISFGTRNYIYAAFAETPFKYANAR
jgi:hypothetical protein